MKKDLKKPWITSGYKTFAYEGPKGLKVERLAKKIGKSKSSFYHHFADLEVFENLLLSYHLEQVQHIVAQEALCTSLEELIDIMVLYKLDLLFNRQLRIHRENPAYERLFTKTNEATAQAIMGVWAEAIGLKDNSYLAGLVLTLSMENFYLQITDETLNHDWLNAYFRELQQMVKAFEMKGNLPTLDASV